MVSMNTSTQTARRLEDHRDTRSGRFGSQPHTAAGFVLTAPADGYRHGSCDECGGPARYDTYLCGDCEHSPEPKFFDEGPAPRTEYQDPCPGKAGTDIEWVDCKRCGGEGVMTQFRDVAGGECFECNGSKGADTPVSVIRRRARDQVRRDNAASEKLHERRLRHNSNYRRAIEMNPSADGWVEAIGENQFLNDLWDKAFAFDLSEKQLAAIGGHFDRKAGRVAAKEAERAAAVEVPEGKYEVTGKILSVEFEDNQFGYGTVAKMTVKDERGFKVHGTAPAALFTEEDSRLEGRKIAFTATVKPGREKGFGFFSRPSKARTVTD